MIKDILENAKKHNKFIGIWTYDDDDGFWSGKVRDYNDEFVSIEHYTKYGKPDGIVLEKIENIQTIDFDDDYAMVMEFLSNNHSKIDAQEEIKVDIPQSDNWQYGVLGKYSNKKDIVVRIQLENDDLYCGMVENSDEESTILRCIGRAGEDDSFSIFKNEDIMMIRINDIDARKRLLLFNWRKKK